MWYIVTTPWWLRMMFPRNLVWNVPSKEKILYLTFDDGPHPGATHFVLDELQKYNAKATFFCIGKNAAAHPELYNRILTEGHRTGNHTNDHLNAFKTKNEDWLNNVKEASKWIDSDLMRPPYGKINSFQAQILQQANPSFRVVMWSVISADFDRSKTPEECFSFVKKNAKSGSIIVFHDSEKAFANMKYALAETLKHFSAEGYRFEVIK